MPIHQSRFEFPASAPNYARPLVHFFELQQERPGALAFVVVVYLVLIFLGVRRHCPPSFCNGSDLRPNHYICAPKIKFSISPIISDACKKTKLWITFEIFDLQAKFWHFWNENDKTDWTVQVSWTNYPFLKGYLAYEKNQLCPRKVIVFFLQS